MPYCVGHSTTGNVTSVSAVGVAEATADGDTGADCTGDDADAATDGDEGGRAMTARAMTALVLTAWAQASSES